MEVMNSLKKHRKENPFVQIDKAIIDDPRLSWKAKGLLMYLLAQSDSWQFYENEICTHSSDGRTSVTSGLNELEKYGYLLRTWVRDENGRYIGRNWEVFEEPIDVDPLSKDEKIEVTKISAGCRKPATGKKSINSTGCRKPETGFSEAGKPATNNINNNNIKEEEEEEGATEKLLTDELHNCIKDVFDDNKGKISPVDLNNYQKEFAELEQEIIAFQNYTAIDLAGDGRKKTYQKWRTEWNFSHEMIMKAAELTCQLAKIPNLQYIDKILYGWFIRKIGTVEEADLAIIRFRDLKDKRKGPNVSKKFAQAEGGYAEYEFYISPEVIKELKQKEG